MGHHDESIASEVRCPLTSSRRCRPVGQPRSAPTGVRMGEVALTPGEGTSSFFVSL